MGQACPVSRPANAFQHAVALEGVLFTAGTPPQSLACRFLQSEIETLKKPKPVQSDASQSPGREKGICCPTESSAGAQAQICARLQRLPAF